MEKENIDVAKLAELSRIELTPEEKVRYEKEIGSILGYVNRIQEADLGDAQPADREAGVIRNVFREDDNPHESGAYSDEILAEVPKRREDYVEVKKIL